jgi:AraC-like DNA-binding protein
MKKELTYENLPISKINPVVLYSHSFDGNGRFAKGEALPSRLVRDYELEYFYDSDGSMYINDTHIPIHKGDIVFRRPGQYTQGIMPYSCFFIALDMANTLSSDANWYKTCLWERVEVGFQTYYQNDILDNIPMVFHAQNEDKYHNLFETVYREYLNPTPGGEMINKSTVLNILYQLYQDCCNPVVTMYSSPYGKVIKNTLDYINENIDRKLSLKQLSEFADLSPNYFHKIFTEVMKITPNDYITSVKLNMAKDLLVRTNQQIYLVADRCGFDNVSYFSFLFKKAFQLTPADYRKRHNYANLP